MSTQVQFYIQIAPSLQTASFNQDIITMSHFRTYQQIFNNYLLRRIVSGLGKEFQSVYNELKQLFLSNIKLTKITSQYSKNLQNILDKLIYKRDFHQIEPFCATNLVKNIKCYRCFTCEKLVDSKQAAYICPMCFESADHKEHNFRYLPSDQENLGKFQFCYCGDEKVIDKRFFCSRHNGETQRVLKTPKEQLIDQKFINQTQILLYIFFRLKGVIQGLQDQHTKKQIFGVKILEKIISYSKKDYSSQIAVAKLLETKYFFEYPFVPEHQKKKSILYIMLRSSYYQEFMETLCMDLLMPLYFVPRIRSVVIKELFECLSQSTIFVTAQSPIKDLRNQFFKATKEMKYVARKGRLAPLVLNYPFTNFSDKSEALLQLFASYKIILNSNDSDEIVTFFIQNMNITQICEFYPRKNEKNYTKQLLSLQSSYLQILLMLMKKISSHEYRKGLLEKIIKQTYNYLKQKKQTFSRSVQRTFAIAFFIYLDFYIENLREQDRQDLSYLLDQPNSDFLEENIKGLIIRSQNLAKINTTKYRHSLIKEMQRHGYCKIMLSIDHIYQRILLKLFLQLQNHNNSTRFSPIISFIQERQKVINTLDQLHNQNKMQKLLEIIDSMFEQIFSMVINSVGISQTTIGQVIIKDFMEIPCPEIVDIYRLLVFLDPKKQPRQFKKYAFNFTRNLVSVNNFIKLQLNSLRRKVENGIKPDNIFNLSYDSLFICAPNAGQRDFLFNLKSLDPKKTEISKFLFTEQSIQTIISIGQKFLKTCKLLCQLNEKQAKDLIFFAFQTLLSLQVETDDQRVRTLLESIIQLNILEDLEFQHYKQMKEMYLTAQKKKELQMYPKSEIKEEKQALQRKSRIQQLKNKILKMQSRTLKQLAISQQKCEINQQSNQENQLCIYCKQNQSNLKLFYPSYCRYSNLMSKVIGQQNYPIMLITTCGHPLHEQCLKKEEQSSQSLNNRKCSLCKAKFNMLMLISEKPSQDQALQFITKIKDFELEVKRDSTFLQTLLYNFHEITNLLSRFIASLVYQIFGYSLYYIKFLAQKILPILKISIKNLRSSRFRESGIQQQIVSQLHAHFRRSQANYEIYSQIFKIIIKFCRGSLQEQQLCNKEILDSLKSSRINHQMETLKHKNIIKLMFAHIFYKNTHFLNYLSDFNAKIHKKQIKSVYNLPLDLQDLNKEIGRCPICRKNTSQIVVCLLCSIRICKQCKNQLKLHLKYHLNKTAFIAVETGHCFYYTQNRIYSKQLYVNLVGEKIPNLTTFPEKNEYLLSQQNKNITLEYILNDYVPSAIAQQQESISSEESQDERDEAQCYVQ